MQPITADNMRKAAIRELSEQIVEGQDKIDECETEVLAKIKRAAENGSLAVNIAVPQYLPLHLVNEVTKRLKNRGFSAGITGGTYWWVNW